MHNWKRIILAVVLAIILGLAVCADSEAPQHDGYILKFKDEKCFDEALDYLEKSGILAGDEDIVSEIYAEETVYKTYDEGIMRIFEELGLLEYSEPDAMCYLLDYDYSKDVYYNSDQLDWVHKCANVFPAWSYGVYGNDVKIAVIDSGVRSTHEELSGRVDDGFSLVTNSPATTGVISHGTAVAGVAAAAANGKGIVGTAHRAVIVPIKVTDSNAFPTSLLYLAVNQAIKLDVDVINMSLGTTDDSSLLKNAIDKAIDSGIIVVAASGNVSASFTQGKAVYPGYYDNVISVGNLMKNDGEYVISSISVANSGVTISAPGTKIRTTTCDSDSSYGIWSGTSFSSPYVAGIAALAKSVDPSINQAEFMELLISTADKSVLNGSERLDTYGYGIADAGALIEELIDRRQKGGFVSPVDRADNGEVSVKVYNPLETPQTYSFIVKFYRIRRPISFAFRTFTLDPGEVTEIPLKYLGGTSFPKVSCYLLDPTKLTPLYKKIDK